LRWQIPDLPLASLRLSYLPLYEWAVLFQVLDKSQFGISGNAAPPRIHDRVSRWIIKSYAPRLEPTLLWLASLSALLSFLMQKALYHPRVCMCAKGKRLFIAELSLTTHKV